MGRVGQLLLEELKSLGDLCHRLKQPDRARAELNHARVLLRTVAQYSDLENQVQRLAKDLGDEKLARNPIPPSVVKELGFIELKAGAQIPSREIGVEEPVHYYAPMRDGSLTIVSLRVVKRVSGAGSPSYALAFVDSVEHGRSSGSGGTSYGCSLDGGRQATFAIDRLGAAERFRLSARLSGP